MPSSPTTTTPATLPGWTWTRRSTSPSARTRLTTTNFSATRPALKLPNDERVISEKGSARIMLKNVQEAKFASTLIPIAARVLTPGARQDLSFNYFFTHILAHELSHGIGPHQIR